MLHVEGWTSTSSLPPTHGRQKQCASGVKLHRSAWNTLDVLKKQSVLGAACTEDRAVTNAENLASTNDKMPGHKHPSGLPWAHPSFDPEVVRVQALEGLESYAESRGGFTRHAASDDV